MGRRTDAALGAVTGAAQCAALALILITATPTEVTNHKATCPTCQVVIR